MVGLDPRPLTLRELYWAWKGRAEFSWAIASNILATIQNSLRGPDQPAVHPYELNPMRSGAPPARGIDLSPDVLMALKPRFER